MRLVLAPRPDVELYAQDYFVYDLTLFHGITLLRNSGGYTIPKQAPDLIISHNPTVAEDVAFLRRFHGESLIVVHLHCQPDFVERDQRPRVLESIRCASSVIVPTSFLATWVKQQAPGTPVHHVPNGARLSLYYPSLAAEREQFRKKYDIPPTKKLIGYVGRLNRPKGIQLLKLLAEHCYRIDAYLFIQFPYGTTVTDRDEFKVFADDLAAVNPYVRVYPDQCPRFPGRPMRFFDALVSTSFSEVQPMVALEALACGIPLVTTLCSPFFDSELSKTKISLEHYRVVPLPKRFKKGANRIKVMKPSELSAVFPQLFKALEETRIPDDRERQMLSVLAGKSGFVDSTMYAQYLKLYATTERAFKARKRGGLRRSRIG